MEINKCIRKLVTERLIDKLWSELYDNKHPIGIIKHVELEKELNYWINESWRLELQRYTTK